MNPSTSEVFAQIASGNLVGILRGETCVFSTPGNINDDMRPTDHCELLEQALYQLASEHGVAYIQGELEAALRGMCTDALGVFCAHQCFYVEIINERAGLSPFSLNIESLPNDLAISFMKEASALHSLEVRPGDLLNDRSYKVVLSGMRILARDHGIDWKVALPQR